MAPHFFCCTATFFCCIANFCAGLQHFVCAEVFRSAVLFFPARTLLRFSFFCIATFRFFALQTFVSEGVLLILLRKRGLGRAQNVKKCNAVFLKNSKKATTKKLHCDIFCCIATFSCCTATFFCCVAIFVALDCNVPDFCSPNPRSRRRFFLKQSVAAEGFLTCPLIGLPLHSRISRRLPTCPVLPKLAWPSC